MADEIDVENGRIYNFQCHVTLTLDRATWHTIVHHSSTPTYVPNFTDIGWKNSLRSHLSFLWSSKCFAFRHCQLRDRKYIRSVKRSASTSGPGSPWQQGDRILSPSPEHCHCHSRVAPLKLDGKAAHATITVFLVYLGSMVPACCLQLGTMPSFNALILLVGW